MTEASGFDTPERASEERESDMHRLLDSMPHMVWMATAENGCDFLNQHWVQYTGVSATKLMGYAWAEHLHPDDRERVVNNWKRAAATGMDLQHDCRIRRHDGAYRWFDTRAVPLRDAGGRIVRWFGTNTDVHETYDARRALADNEERLRYVELATRDATYDWDMRTGQTHRNESFQDLFGAPSVAESSEQWWEKTVHPDDRQRIVDAANSAFKARAPQWSCEYRLKRVDGSYAIVTDRAYLLYDSTPKRKPLRMIGALADITEHKLAEQSLRDMQARLLSALEGASMATWIWDIQADRLYWDDAAYLLWGRKPAESPVVTLAATVEFIHPDDRPRIQAAIEEFYNTGIDTIVEFRTLRPDAKLQWLQVRGHIERDPAGRPIRMAGVYIDMTERRQVEQTLRDAQARLLSAMEAGGLATWIWDIQSNEFIWDDATCRLWGQAPEEYQRPSLEQVFALMHSEDRERVVAASEEFFRTGVNRTIEFRTQRPDGALQWLVAKGLIERDASGQPIRMAGAYVDITDRKRAEEAQLRTQKMEALGTLAGGIAHDFNNILLAISGNAKLAIDDLQSALPADHPVQRSLAEIDKASTRAADLVRRILTFSRQQDTQREALHLQPLVEEALRLLRPTLPASVEIRTLFAADAPLVATDAIQIHQVIMNLVTNAAHAIGERHGVIKIELQTLNTELSSVRDLDQLPAGRYACLSVSDTGSGIDKLIVDRIFDPFFTTKLVGQGTGLGLAVVHGIVKAHGGAIVVDSEIGKGTTFRLYFPVTETLPSRSESIVASPRRGHGEHVLYVDDEESLVFLVTRVLERLGYRVTGCVDPVQALKELTANPRGFDVLVTDLSMRGMNGFELTREARAIRGDLPVLLTSGYLRSEDRETAQQFGIREMILKPNTVEELGQAIDRALTEIRSLKASR